MDKLTSILGLKKKGLKVLFVSSEEAPFAKVGGLGEVVFSLPRALKRLGHDARVMIPLYGNIDREKFKLAYVHKNLSVPTAPDGGANVVCNVRKYESKGSDKEPVTTYFLENQEYYEMRSNVYGYTDDRIRFALLSRGCLEFLSIWKGWIPDIIVCADWMTGYLPNYLQTEYKGDKALANVTTVFSIHNLAIQGTDKPQRFTPEMARDDGYGPLPGLFDARMNDINPMRRGIIHADIVNTVSPTYAREITTEEYGEGLEELLREKHDDLFGILNGIDYKTNNPATDPLLAAKFSSLNFDARKANKAALQKRLGLPQDKNVFMMGIASRISRQKGFVLLQPTIETFFADDRIPTRRGRDRRHRPHGLFLGSAKKAAYPGGVDHAIRQQPAASHLCRLRRSAHSVKIRTVGVDPDGSHALRNRARGAQDRRARRHYRGWPPRRQPHHRVPFRQHGSARTPNCNDARVLRMAPPRRMEEPEKARDGKGFFMGSLGARICRPFQKGDRSAREKRKGY